MPNKELTFEEWEKRVLECKEEILNYILTRYDDTTDEVVDNWLEYIIDNELDIDINVIKNGYTYSIDVYRVDTNGNTLTDDWLTLK